MVFESVVANLLNTYLGHFIDDVNASQLQLGVWKGNVELKNLTIKDDAFSTLDLPFRILNGSIKKLTAEVPWSSLYSSPVKLNLEDVYVVAVPNVSEEYNEEVEAEREWQAKRKKINLHEATKKNLEAQADAKIKKLNQVAQEDDGFATKLAAQVIRNVQILITNLHIVYEDRFTDSSSPFQAGLTLNKIVFQTVDDASTAQQREKYSEIQNKELVFKVTEINNLAVYFNCDKDIHFLSDLQNQDEIEGILRKRILSTLSNVPNKNMDFILKPVTFRGNLVINSKPEKYNFDIPVADIDMVLGDFTVNLKKNQIHCISSWMESLTRIRIAANYRKFRPSVSISSHSEEWWQFALSSILERDIKPRRSNWNWKRIKKHRQLCREYQARYRDKLLCDNIEEKIGIDSEMEWYERQLDIFNIILCRSQIEIECRHELEKRKAEQAEKKTGWFSLSSWTFGGWTGDTSTKGVHEKETIVTNFQREINQDEKEKLYEAIGYDSSSVGVLDTPKEFVGFIINFRLNSVKAVVTGFDENFRVGEFCMRNIQFSVQYRPAAGAAHISTSFDSTSILTSTEDPSLRVKSSSWDSKRKTRSFPRSSSKSSDDPTEDFGLHLESKKFKLDCAYEPNQDGTSITLEGAVDDIQMKLTKFITYLSKAPDEITYYILNPCTIQMLSQQDPNNHVMHVIFSNLDVRIAPQAYQILTTVIGAFQGTSEIKIVEKEPPKANEILQPRLLSRDSRYRPKECAIERATEVTEDMNFAVQSTIAANIQTDAPNPKGPPKRQVYLDMKNINFVVEDSVTNPQPLIRFHSSIFGSLQDSQSMKFECQCLLNYFNVSKSSWEPMIEPVGFDSGKAILWKFDALIDFRELNGKSLIEMQVISKEQLDLTITKTAINVLLSLLDSISEENGNRQEKIKTLPPAPKVNKCCIKLRNLLPFCIKYNIIGKSEVHELGPGEEGNLEGIKYGQTEIRMKLNEYLGGSWVADSTISGITEDEDFDTWKFYPSVPSRRTSACSPSSLDPLPYNPGHRRTESNEEYCLTLFLATTKDQKDQVVSSLFSPYWLINKTHQPISWNFSRRGYCVSDPGNLDYPVLMSYKQSLFSKKRMHIKVGHSDFSDGFPVDSVGSKGSVIVKGRDGFFYVIAVHITMSRVGLTKIVTLHPFYLILNKTKRLVEFSEDNDEFTTAMPKDATPFWPYRQKDLKLYFRFAESPEVSSKPVSLTISNGTLLAIDNKLLYVTIEVEQSEVHVTVEDYFEGCSSVLFVNATDDCMLSYHQTNCKQQSLIPPMQYAHFTWQDPLGERTVMWSIKDVPKQLFNPRYDMISFSEDKETVWVSFVDGAQRVFLVTHDLTHASEMMHALELVQPQVKITLQSKGFGLSLVDDIAGLEIAYLGIAPHDDKTGIWGYIGYSEHTTQLHFKLSHMQIDNQMSDCMFSTIMSQNITPRSTGITDRKPFFEISAIMQRQANLRRFKYLSLLVQEFFINIEYSFIQHLLEFSDEASSWYYRNYTHKEMIETDLSLVMNSHELLIESTTRSNRVLYDLIHFSPIKLNVSFSLSSSTSSNSRDQKDDGVSLPLGLDFIIRSAGVTLTEFQDVTFKLDCFERTMVLFTPEQLMWASLDHYKRQILKQFYAIVLGLDVIGNPVSLVMDLKQGVGDFFYEPIQGIIKGPEEAVEGLANGVASLFSHTVGGSIGALSKISGTLGDGISSLTFDDDLKRRRRMRRREQPNIARRGKDLFEGFVGGITGLVKKPVSGAKEDGIEGFVKGVGKGVVGVLTQPATSIVDFATGTLNALKICVNDEKGPTRLRPPRVIVVGIPLQPYNRQEAERLARNKS